MVAYHNTARIKPFRSGTQVTVMAMVDFLSNSVHLNNATWGVIQSSQQKPFHGMVKEYTQWID